MCQSPTLAPAREAPVDQFWIAHRALTGAQAKTLHDPWSIALYQRIGLTHKSEGLFQAVRGLEIERDHSFPFAQRVVSCGKQFVNLKRLRTCNDRHLSAH